VDQNVFLNLSVFSERMLRDFRQDDRFNPAASVVWTLPPIAQSKVITGCGKLSSASKRAFALRDR
jgi:hypothetical protein